MKAYITHNPGTYEAMLLKEHFDATIIQNKNGSTSYMVIFAPLTKKEITNFQSDIMLLQSGESVK